jgi:hypothetical protein
LASSNRSDGVLKPIIELLETAIGGENIIYVANRDDAATHIEQVNAASGRRLLRQIGKLRLTVHVGFSATANALKNCRAKEPALRSSHLAKTGRGTAG